MTDIFSIQQECEPIRMREIFLREGESSFVLPFTRYCVPIALHYIRAADIRGYIPCSEVNCVICRAGFGAPKKVAYLPVVDCDSVCPAALRLDLSKRDGLLKNLRPFLQREDLAQSLMLTRKNSNDYLVVSSDGVISPRVAGLLKEFEAMTNAQLSEMIESLFPKYTDQDFWADAIIRERLQNRGVKIG